MISLFFQFADKTKQVFATATKQMQIQTKQIHLPTKLSSSKHKDMSGKEKTPQPLGDVNTTSSMSDSFNSEQEMVRNPKASGYINTSITVHEHTRHIYTTHT